MDRGASSSSCSVVRGVTTMEFSGVCLNRVCTDGDDEVV